MDRVRTCRRVALVVAFLSFCLPALGADQTFVSVDGRDTWACTRAKPCRTIAQALTLTSPGGTIMVLDSGRFAETYIDIRQAVSIVAAPGVIAELTSADSCIYVNAGLDDVVVLRGLTFTGQPTTPNNGIIYNRAAALHVENCVVSGFPTKGILSLSHQKLFVSDSVFRGNFIGISLDSHTDAAIDRVRLENNGWGLVAGLGARATVRDSVASGNTEEGFLASGMLADSPEMNLEGCMASDNGAGIAAEGFMGGSAVARVSRCVVTNNTVGVAQHVGGVVESRGNNTVRGNGTDVSGVVTAIPGI